MSLRDGDWTGIGSPVPAPGRDRPRDSIPVAPLAAESRGMARRSPGGGPARSVFRRRRAPPMVSQSSPGPNDSMARAARAAVRPDPVLRRAAPADGSRSRNLSWRPGGGAVRRRPGGVSVPCSGRAVPHRRSATRSAAAAPAEPYLTDGPQPGPPPPPPSAAAPAEPYLTDDPQPRSAAAPARRSSGRAVPHRWSATLVESERHRGVVLLDCAPARWNVFRPVAPCRCLRGRGCNEDRHVRLQVAAVRAGQPRPHVENPSPSTPTSWSSISRTRSPSRRNRGAREVVAAFQAPRRALGYVRVNAFDTPFCFDDLQAVVTPVSTASCCRRWSRLPSSWPPTGRIASLERARAWRRAASTSCRSSKPAAAWPRCGTSRVPAPGCGWLSFGAGDYTLDVGMRWTFEERELDHARAAVVLESRAAGLDPPIDTVFIHLGEPDAPPALAPGSPATSGSRASSASIRSRWVRSTRRSSPATRRSRGPSATSRRSSRRGERFRLHPGRRMLHRPSRRGEGAAHAADRTAVRGRGIERGAA